MPARTSKSGKSATEKPRVAPPKKATEEREESTLEQETAPELRLLGELRPVTTREERIQIAAYWRAANRQFAPGHELDDWLHAEREVDEEDRGHKSR